MFSMWNNMFDPNEAMKAWSDGMKKMYDASEDTTKTFTENFERIYGERNEIFKNWKDSFGKMYGSEEWAKSFGNGLFNLDEQKAIFKKLLGSTEVYNSLFEFWSKAMQAAPYDSPEKIVKFCKDYRETYMNTIGSMLKASAIGEYAPSVEQYMELYKSYIGFFDKLSMPWTEGSEEFYNIHKKMMSGNPDAVKEYFDMFNETYKKSFGQFLNMSSFGLYKENIEAQMQGVDSYVQFVNIYNELNALVYKVFSDSMEVLMDKYSKLLNEDKQPKTFKEFYDLWLDINEHNLINLFGTEEFSKVYCGVAEKYCDFKIKFDKLAGMYLKVLPLPSKEDMDSLYQTAYNQRKEIKSLKAEIANLKAVTDEVDVLRKEVSKLSNLEKEFADFKKSMSKKAEV